MALVLVSDYAFAQEPEPTRSFSIDSRYFIGMPSNRAIGQFGLDMADLATLPADLIGPGFEPTHIRRTATVRFDAAPAEVFAVLAPTGQQSLTQTWDIEILSPASGEVEPGATFTKTHKRAGVQQIWTVVAVDAPEKLTYAIFVAGLETWVFAMELKSVGDGITSVDVTHTITSLSPDANADVQQFADTFDTYFASWSASIRRALEGRTQ